MHVALWKQNCVFAIFYIARPGWLCKFYPNRIKHQRQTEAASARQRWKRTSGIASVSAGSRPGIWGGRSQIGGAKKVFTCLNTKCCLRQSLGITQKWLLLYVKKWLFLLVELCDFFGNNHRFKALYSISLIQKLFETDPKQWASFLTSYTYIVYLQTLFKRHKSMLRTSVFHCFGYS